ncbi:BON domain-containing protein [Coleofasciculus sp. FACHB-64]|jgi:osmotically-inducible protein OsmY|uniref:BON domain-containing protein n=1 Tax=Cyanophyceae TaxID=3028117 RepID=UPI0016861910|nr:MULTISPECIES: BON domain-containing protein [unclassified Coleofasciculus]MBD1840987.1 BON domain-containing protein [Coleofasciculus sp. FACHB-501]MBD1879124.1 BON domain-containing protein [Coleofasciculus sp. FACHB-T130]MBD1891060.1 BON domain-containing protein [Coleofasciculus sp. FACHB-SPT9]MBD1896673.1 BON domain-containing protein [Coleofasciculus sp. FACHB-129]MBD1898718.1 BON domain-containing protein [Coleofasciculus sp. FACHB-125]
MGWLKRLFGMEKPQNAQTNAVPAPTAQAPASTGTASSSETIPPERVGLTGEYDQSGLAKRVALAFDQDPDLDDINTLYVAQTGGTVVLKGQVPSQQILNQMVSVARSVEGATGVQTDQVTIG